MAATTARDFDEVAISMGSTMVQSETGFGFEWDPVEEHGPMLRYPC
jgi:hypothetical protein